MLASRYLNAHLTKNIRDFAMAITRVWIEEGCVSCGTSEKFCPGVFKLKWVEHDSAVVREGVDYSLYEEKIMEAAKNCPVGVIKYEEV